jgi:glycosyltransferase involved in cell wall biosynthesis
MIATAGRAERIIRADETLLATYMLKVAAQPEWRGFTEENAARFLLWFALTGRHDHRGFRIGPEFRSFLTDPTPPFATRLTGYVYLKDGDARARFGRDHEAFDDWCRGEGAERHRLGPLSFLNESPREPGAGTAARPGVNLVGFAGGVMGLGEDVRMMAAALRHAGCAVCIVEAPLSGRRVSVAAHGLESLTADRPLFETSVFCLPPTEMMRLRVEQGADLFSARRNIGCWPWELTTLPDEWRMAFDLVDEIWAISPFLLEVYRRRTSKPVRLAHPHVGLGDAPPVSRHELGFGEEDFILLSMFDLNSFTARKNPEGSIAAFRAAFPDRAGRERLLIKTLNGHAHPEALGALAKLAGGDDRVRLIDGAFSRPRTLGLIAMCDALLSLHRAEGFGRILAEAMLLGVPVVATDWSGSRSYLDDETGWPVACSTRLVAPGEYIPAPGGEWAEPDLASAAAALRRLAGDPRAAREKARMAKLRVTTQHGLDPVAANLLALLRNDLRTTGSDHVSLEQRRARA